jgi:hypothetical protein
LQCVKEIMELGKAGITLDPAMVQQLAEQFKIFFI